MVQFEGLRDMKLQFENQKQYKLTLPKKVIEAIGWGKGAKIKVELDQDQNMILKKL